MTLRPFLLPLHFFGRSFSLSSAGSMSPKLFSGIQYPLLGCLIQKLCFCSIEDSDFTSAAKSESFLIVWADAERMVSVSATDEKRRLQEEGKNKRREETDA